MAGVIVPQGRKEGALDTVMKGLAIARDVYGIKADSAKADALESEAATNQAETARKASGKLNKGEQLSLFQKGFMKVPAGTAGAESFEDADKPGLIHWVAKNDAPKLRPPTTQKVGDDLLEYDDESKSWKKVYSPPPKPEKPAKDITVAERNTLQNQYDRDPEVRKTKEVLGSWEASQGLLDDPSPAASQALIYNWMKSLDPGSVVRETEAESAQALGGLQERAKAKFQELAGGGSLTYAQKKDLLNQIELRAKAATTRQTKIDKQFGDLASRRGVDLQDLRFVSMPEFKEAFTGKNPAGVSGSSGEAQAAPAGEAAPLSDIDAELARRGVKPKSRGTSGGF